MKNSWFSNICFVVVFCIMIQIIKIFCEYNQTTLAKIHVQYDMRCHLKVISFKICSKGSERVYNFEEKN